MEMMTKIESEFALGSEGGAGRDKDEMSDTAEVLRAALLGDKDEVKPDYLLQMRLTIPTTFPRPLSLKDRPELAAFFKANPDFSDIQQYDPSVKGSEAKVHSAFPIRIQTPWHYAESESKLIDIKTGSVLWIGSIRSQSYHIEKFTIAYAITRVIDKAWGDNVTKAVSEHNAELDRLEKEARKAEVKLKATYQRFQNTVQLDSEQVAGYEALRQREINEAQRAYSAACNALTNHQSAPPAKATERPRFLYVVSDPLITPDLRVTLEMLNGQSQRKDCLLYTSDAADE